MKLIRSAMLLLLATSVLTSCAFFANPVPVGPVQLEVQIVEPLELTTEDGKARVKCEEGKSPRGQAGAWIYFQRLLEGKWINVIDPKWATDCDSGRIWGQWIQNGTELVRQLGPEHYEEIATALKARWLGSP